MNLNLENYLPRYLSDESNDSLIQNLHQFPDNIDERFYINFPDLIVLQGDGYRNLLIINLPSREIQPGNGIIISNTCDLFNSDRKLYDVDFTYAPIINFAKFSNLLTETYSGDPDKLKKIDSTLISIKQQHVSNIFFLPANHYFNESIVFLDKLISCNVQHINQCINIEEDRLFSLSQYAHYLLLFKMSFHFSRIKEKIDRDKGIVL